MIAGLSAAHDIAQRSLCKRLHVGAVILSDDGRLLSQAHNGNIDPHGNPCACDTDIPGACGCIHAEELAAIRCTYRGPKHLYCTHNPCLQCAKRIVLLGGVVSIHYATEYRDASGISYLRNAGLAINHRLVLRSSTGQENINVRQS